jgi:hypothetical protein
MDQYEWVAMRKDKGFEGNWFGSWKTKKEAQEDMKNHPNPKMFDIKMIKKIGPDE